MNRNAFVDEEGSRDADHERKNIQLQERWRGETCMWDGQLSVEGEKADGQDDFCDDKANCTSDCEPERLHDSIPRLELHDFFLRVGRGQSRGLARNCIGARLLRCFVGTAGGFTDEEYEDD